MSRDLQKGVEQNTILRENGSFSCACLQLKQINVASTTKSDPYTKSRLCCATGIDCQHCQVLVPAVFLAQPGFHDRTGLIPISPIPAGANATGAIAGTGQPSAANHPRQSSGGRNCRSGGI
jgi:hypothetical protein